MALAPCLLSPRWPCFRMGTCRGSSGYWAQSTVAGLSVCTGSGEGSVRGLCEKSKSDPPPCPVSRSSGGWASRAERVCSQKVMGLGEIIFGKSNGNRMDESQSPALWTAGPVKGSRTWAEAFQDNPSGTRMLSAMAGQCCPRHGSVYSPQPPISLFCFSVPLPRG